MPTSPTTSRTVTHNRPKAASFALATWLLFAAIFGAVQIGSLFNPPLMDDVDAAHAQAAQGISETGDWVTSKINGIRYIEKPPLPYWLSAGLYRIFGQNVFAMAMGTPRLGTPRRALCWSGRPNLHRPFSLYPLHHSRGPA